MRSTAGKKKKMGSRLRLPERGAGYPALSAFFDRHEGFWIRALWRSTRIVKIWTGCCLEYWNQPNTKQLNIRIQATAKRMIERLAKRKTVEVSTLVRMWVIDSMRRDDRQP